MIDLAEAMKHGKPKFSPGDIVEFIATICLEYYQEIEEEVRCRTVEKWTKGKINKAIPTSAGWRYAVHIENTAYSIVDAPEYILQWYDTYMDEEARSIIYNKITCTCTIDTLMKEGCQCGYLK